MEEKDILDQHESGTEQADGAAYIEAIKEMRRTTVPREQFDKLREENRALLQSLVNGESIDLAPAEAPADIPTLRRELFEGEHSNLEYAKKSLALRKAVMEAGYPDPFLPSGHNVQITPQDVECAEQTAAAFAHCVEYADGDSAVFTNELMRLTRDNFRPNTTKRRI